MTSVNGWTNRETWVVNMWADEMFRRTPTPEDFEYLEETLEDEFLEKVGNCNIYTDLMNFGAINWHELKETAKENLDE